MLLKKALRGFAGEVDVVARSLAAVAGLVGMRAIRPSGVSRDNLGRENAAETATVSTRRLLEKESVEGGDCRAADGPGRDPDDGRDCALHEVIEGHSLDAAEVGVAVIVVFVPVGTAPAPRLGLDELRKLVG